MNKSCTCWSNISKMSPIHPCPSLLTSHLKLPCFTSDQRRVRLKKVTLKMVEMIAIKPPMSTLNTLNGGLSLRSSQKISDSDVFKIFGWWQMNIATRSECSALASLYESVWAPAIHLDLLTEFSFRTIFKPELHDEVGGEQGILLFECVVNSPEIQS